MFSLLPRGSYIDERISKNYGKEVLLANWQELRLGSAEKNDCILPGLKRIDACEKHITEIKDNYVPSAVLEDADDSTRNFLGARNESLNNHQRNRQCQVRFPLTKDMSSNYTTTYTILYEIVPKQQARATAAVEQSGSVPTKMEDRDLMLSYGNRSKTGKFCRLRAELQLEKSQRLETSYAADYNKRQPALKNAANEQQ
ncbi:uncharacterized protein LOC115767121 [Drosophila novamexicana]|uniref:uncharacterized protein LOC115767121 n=1 Tax=Drosophila novamexicana TaxID=47314 RepID=UPI0011E5ABD7|nr:uncharacterized protein LOC115767121 [Drosophila novamexicana]